MKLDKNSMAIAGCIMSICSVPLFAAGFLCLIGVMLSPTLALVFGTLAGAVGAAGVVVSGIGCYRSYSVEMRGAGFSIAGLIIGTMVLTLVLAIMTLMIVLCV